MNRIAPIIVSAGLLLALPAAAQQSVPAPPRPAGPQAPVQAQVPAPVFDSQGAGDTREQLHEILRDYPPSVGRILALDPTLTQRDDYMAPYPRLHAFLQQHPEIVRNPVFFFGTEGNAFGVYRDTRQPRERAIDMFGDILGGFAFFVVGMTAITLVFTLLKQTIDYRRWLRNSRAQSEVHSKILDRMQSNEDLLAYIQTPAGRRFLESSPFGGGAPGAPAVPDTIAAPISRILWSVQAGVVIAALGVGLWSVQGSVIEEIAPAFNVMGTVALAVGLGFIVSAAAAYALSARLGLVSSAGHERA